jgi:cytidylate kinase
MPEPVRIQKALADAGVASRRAAETLVAAGRVEVNGEPARVGQRVDPATDLVTVDGRPLAAPPQAVYLVLNKPAGVTSTVSDRHALHTVVDLVPPDIRRRATRIYPVGRLDRDSEGLLLLTNDGHWAQRMLHPRHGVEREYAVGVIHPLSRSQWRSLETGVQLEEGSAAAAALHLATASEVNRLARLLGSDVQRLAWYHVTLRQGWRRQVRRMFAAVSAPVERLVRIRFGTIRLGDMSLGEVRPLSSRERRQLETLVGGDAPDHRAPRRRLVVSVDGPGGSGKSSVGARAATRLGYRFADTGVLYRGLTLLAVEDGTDPDDASALAQLADDIELKPDENDRYVILQARGRDVTSALHTPDVDRLVSRISRHPEVRAALMPVQRRLAAEGGMIMAGRDIGTVVLPDADVKLFLNVSLEERARRRAQERGLADDPESLGRIEQELRLRDGIDSTRAAAPLRVPDDATVIDTEGNTLDQTVDLVVGVIERRARQADDEGAP